jgi:biotin carboxyl carrier protein
MKMEHVVRAAGDATVAAVSVEAGQQVEAGAVLVVLAEA